MKFFFDTEFIEDGHTIDLLSIGIISEINIKFYAETSYSTTQTARSKANLWVRENVFPHLKGMDYVRTNTELRRELLAYIMDCCIGEKPEFWAYYADYDWVVLCQLFGTMMDLPKSWPMFCMDIKQLCVHVGNPKLPAQTTTEHSALNDALWNKECYEWLVKHYVEPKEQLLKQYRAGSED